MGSKTIIAILAIISRPDWVHCTEFGSKTSAHGCVGLEHQIIDITISPGFAGFERKNDGVLGLAKMFVRMFIFGIVATAHVAALHAQPQMDPIVAHFEAFFTTFATRRDLFNGVFMLARTHVTPSRPSILFSIPVNGH